MALFAVTGAAGFIGSHLVDALLRAGHDVRGLDDLSSGRAENVDRRCDLTVGDVADPVAVRKLLRGTAGCFHLAAIASVTRGNEQWRDTHRINQTGTVTVLEAAAEAGRLPVVYASSAAVYGDVGHVAAHEECRPAPLTAYGADKLGSELHARVGFIVHGVPSLGLRFFNVYGPRQDASSPYSGVISIFSERIANGSMVTVYGNGAQTRDFVYVSDVVTHLIAGMRHVAAHPGAMVLNVATGRGTSLLKLVDILSGIHERVPLVTHGLVRAGDISQSIGDVSRCVATLGIRADVTLEEGLTEMSAKGPPGVRPRLRVASNA